MKNFYPERELSTLCELIHFVQQVAPAYLERNDAVVTNCAKVFKIIEKSHGHSI